MSTRFPSFPSKGPLLAIAAVGLLLSVGAALRGGDAEVSGAPGRALGAPVERDAFSFVVFGDRTGGAPDGLADLAEAVRSTNEMDPDLVMTVGDLVEGYGGADEWLEQMREYRDVMDGLAMPWYPVAGNHDVYGPPGGGHNHVELYQRHFAPLYYSFDYRWAHFVILYTDEALSFHYPEVDQNLSEQQLRWLEGDLAGTRAEQVYVFLHHPRWRYEGTNWPEVHALLRGDGRVRAVFAGHLHRYEDDGETDGIHYYVMGITGALERPGSARGPEIAHLRVRRDGFRMGLVPVRTTHTSP